MRRFRPLLVLGLMLVALIILGLVFYQPSKQISTWNQLSPPFFSVVKTVNVYLTYFDTNFSPLPPPRVPDFTPLPPPRVPDFSPLPPPRVPDFSPLPPPRVPDFSPLPPPRVPDVS